MVSRENGAATWLFRIRHPSLGPGPTAVAVGPVRHPVHPRHATRVALPDRGGTAPPSHAPCRRRPRHPRAPRSPRHLAPHHRFAAVLSPDPVIVDTPAGCCSPRRALLPAAAAAGGAHPRLVPPATAAAGCAAATVPGSCCLPLLPSVTAATRRAAAAARHCCRPRLVPPAAAATRRWCFPLSLRLSAPVPPLAAATGRTSHRPPRCCCRPALPIGSAAGRRVTGALPLPHAAVAARCCLPLPLPHAPVAARCCLPPLLSPAAAPARRFCHPPHHCFRSPLLAPPDPLLARVAVAAPARRYCHPSHRFLRPPPLPATGRHGRADAAGRRPSGVLLCVSTFGFCPYRPPPHAVAATRASPRLLAVAALVHPATAALQLRGYVWGRGGCAVVVRGGGAWQRSRTAH